LPEKIQALEHRQPATLLIMTSLARHRILMVICVVAIIATLLLPRIAQDPLYHQFADQGGLLSIPNAFNVLSNLLFGWVGAAGLYRLIGEKSLHIEAGIYPAYFCFFAALILIATGSAYYHWSPDNQSLSWDRLPMTIAFMSFFTILIAERISVSLARKLFPMLLAAGVASIVYWHFSELAGRGDLRPYALVQFLPILLIPLILLMFESAYNRNADLWWFLAWFLISKICELLDAEIYNWLVLVSGHSLKHITAGIGCLVFLRYLRLRRRLHQ
jgi:hypothetical protein